MENEENKKALLSEIYTDLKNPASFSSLERLYREAKNTDPTITRKDVRLWAEEHETYSLHKKNRLHFPRRKTITHSIDDQWQMDILSLIQYSKYNDQYKYILTVIDVFSRYAFARKLKTKLGKEVATAINDIFYQEKRVPKLIQVDQGGEFLNKFVKDLLDRNKVNLFSVYSDTKASLVERFNRTL